MAENRPLAIVYSIMLLLGRTGAYIQTTMNNEFMICTSVTGVFGTVASENGVNDDRPVLQGPGGARGPAGKSGLPGPRGEPNYDKVTSMVENKLQTIQARVFRLESEIQQLKANGFSGGSTTGIVAPTLSPEEAKNARDCMDKFKSPLNIDTMCYSIIGGDGLQWTFKDAESNCTKLGGYLADLNARSLYDKVYDYIDRTFSTVVQAWTGMRYEKENLIQTDGKQAGFVKWMAYNPRKSSTSYSTYYSSYTYVYVNIDTSSRIMGLQNTPASKKLAYAICHYDMSNAATTRRSTTTQKTTTSSYDDYDSDYYYYSS
ncbi:uncharacterized protein LOC120344050 [Styela clava]